MVINFDNFGGGGGSGSGYTLPIASNSTLGGIKVGSGLTINPQSGVLNADAQAVSTATTTTAGVVKPSSGLSIDSAGTLTTQVQSENVGNHVVKIWLGTQSEYDLISTPDEYTVYVIKKAPTQGN